MAPEGVTLMKFNSQAPTVDLPFLLLAGGILAIGPLKREIRRFKKSGLVVWIAHPGTVRGCGRRIPSSSPVWATW